MDADSCIKTSDRWKWLHIDGYWWNRRNVEHLFEDLELIKSRNIWRDHYRDFRYLILIWWHQRECGNVADHLFGNVEHPGYQDSKQTGPGLIWLRNMLCWNVLHQDSKANVSCSEFLHIWPKISIFGQKIQYQFLFWQSNVSWFTNMKKSSVISKPWRNFASS